MQSWEFDCLSESQFENIPEEISEDDKVYIYAVTTRLRRILNWNPQDECQLYNRQRGYETMRELLSLFYTWKEFMYHQSEAPDNRGRQHLVVFSLARLLLYYWITDSILVAEVVREIFECDGHFSSMFAHVVNKSDGRSLLRQTSGYSTQREDSATIFFLHHAYKAKLEFSGVRFQDLPLQYPLEVSPVFLTIIYNKPRILLHLLRFGATVDILPRRMLDGWNLPMILRHLIRTLWNFLGETPRHEDVYPPVTSIMSDAVNQTTECLRILLRVIPQITMGEIHFLLLKFENGVLSGSRSSHDFIRQLSERCIVPKFVNRYLQPAELQHLCRCVIRDALNRTWNLPYGIASLPLPTFLKKYLSLAYD